MALYYALYHALKSTIHTFFYYFYTFVSLQIIVLSQVYFYSAILKHNKKERGRKKDDLIPIFPKLKLQMPHIENSNFAAPVTFNG